MLDIVSAIVLRHTGRHKERFTDGLRTHLFCTYNLLNFEQLYNIIIILIFNKT